MCAVAEDLKLPLARVELLHHLLPLHDAGFDVVQHLQQDEAGGEVGEEVSYVGLHAHGVHPVAIGLLLERLRYFDL